MKKTFLVSLLLVGLVVGSALPVGAQRRRVAPAPATPLSALPQSDGVISIDMQRLLNDFLPRVLADDPAKLAEVNSGIDRAKTRAGIDVRKFERVAVGMRFLYPTPTTIKVESVAVARGRFDAPAMLAAGLETAKGKYTFREEKHGDKTIYIFDGQQLYGDVGIPDATVGEQAKKSKVTKVLDDLLQKVLNFKNGEVGVVALDANTLAVGQPSMVRAAIDVGARSRLNASLVQMATRSPNAVLGFGINVPPNVSKYLGLDNDELSKNIDLIRQLHGSIAESSVGFDLQTAAVAESPKQAQDLHNTLVGVRELGGFLVGSLSGDKGKLAKTALQNLKISKQGNEVRLGLEMTQSDVAMLVRIF